MIQALELKDYAVLSPEEVQYSYLECPWCGHEETENK